MRRLFLIAAALAAAPAAAAAPPTETAVLAGGCFWGLEGVFEHVKGVRDVVSGYAGGSSGDASYDKVSAEITRHAEAVRIVYDPTQLSYAQILQIYFTVAHDPTQLNRQGPDEGTSYRSAIFPANPAQRRTAQVMIARLAAGSKRPIVTRLENGQFFKAESYHQDFMRKNPYYPYILAHDVPKVAALKRAFPALYRD